MTIGLEEQVENWHVARFKTRGVFLMIKNESSRRPQRYAQSLNQPW